MINLYNSAMNRENSVLPNGYQARLLKLKGLSFLNDEDRQFIAEEGRYFVAKRNTVLFEEGELADRFFILISGAVKLTKKIEGSVTLVDILSTGEVLGAAIMLKQEPANFPVAAQAMIPTELIELKKSFFQDYWRGRTHLFEYVIQQIATRVQRLQNDKTTQRMKLDQKLAYYLTEKVSPIANLRMTRQDLANAVGATNESVIRILSEWSKQGLISTQRQEIKVHDLEKMKLLWNQD